MLILQRLPLPGLLIPRERWWLTTSTSFLCQSTNTELLPPPTTHLLYQTLPPSQHFQLQITTGPSTGHLDHPTAQSPPRAFTLANSEPPQTCLPCPTRKTRGHFLPLLLPTPLTLQTWPLLQGAVRNTDVPCHH